MCGIAGFYKFGDQNPDISTLKRLWLLQQSRGEDAAGVGYLDPITNMFSVIRRPEAVKDLLPQIGDAQWTMIAASPMAMFHARAATKGDPKDNENNHPVIDGSWVVTHNGMITNDDDLYEHYKTPRSAAVDTITVPMVLNLAEDYDTALLNLTLLDGSASLALWNKQNPRWLALARLGYNPLFLFYDPRTEILYWSSIALIGRELSTFRLGALHFTTLGRLDGNQLLVLRPEGSSLFEIKRNPFRRRVLVSRPLPVVSVVRGGATIVKHAITVASIQSLVRTFSDEPTWPSLMITPNSFVWDKFDLLSVLKKLNESTDTTTYQETTLGNWVLRKEAGGIHRSFFAHKRLKKHLHRHYRDTPLSLPTENPNGLDLKVHLLRITVTEKVGVSLWECDTGVCPWCGVWARMRDWAARKFQCNYCRIFMRGETFNVDRMQKVED